MNISLEGITRYVVVDLDGTLCDVGHRLYLAQAKEWDNFHSQLSFDVPVVPVLEVLRMIDFASSVGWPVEIIAVTGRSEKWRHMTLDWLVKYDIPIMEILMRPDDDFTPDGELKIRMLEDHFGAGFSTRKEAKDTVLEKVLFAIEDRDHVVNAYRSYGITCWQVAEGKY